MEAEIILGAIAAATSLGAGLYKTFGMSQKASVIKQVRTSAFQRGVAEGKDSIETYTAFQTRGLFGRRVQYIVAVYDRQEKRLRHLSGNTESVELFSDIPSDVKEAIKIASINGVPILN